MQKPRHKTDEELIQEARENEIMDAFYRRRKDFQERMAQTKKPQTYKRTALRSNIIWLAACFIILVVYFLLYRFRD